jgi:hypothetical protein
MPYPWTIAAAAALLVLAGPARGQAVAPLPGEAAACAGPADPLAAALCADPAARLADRRRALVYEALRHQLHPAQRPGLEADARAFEAFLRQHCLPGGQPDPACLLRAQEAKRDDLRRWLQPPATEEAEREPGAAEALNARFGLPGAPEARREAIAALQARAGLTAHGFLDDRTAGLPPVPPVVPQAVPPALSQPALPQAGPGASARPAAPPSAEGPPAGTVWLPRFPAALGARYAITRCNAPTATWVGNALRIGDVAEHGESYEIFADRERFYLLPPAGAPRILEGLPDGRLRLSGAIPPALARLGVTPGKALRRCD